MATLEVGSASGAAIVGPGRLPNQQPRPLSGTALLLYRALQATAAAARDARGYVKSVTRVTVHIPLEIVAEACGRHRVTIWRAAKQLREAGLVDSRPHKTTLDGQTVNDGTLWCVKLNPDDGSPAPRLAFEELKHGGWRDLARDRKRGRTAYRQLQQRRAGNDATVNRNLLDTGFNLKLLLEWSLPPQAQEASLLMTVAPRARHDLETLLDVQHASREERGAMVEAAAAAAASRLRDAGSVMFWRWLLWQLLRLQDAQGAAPWLTIYHEVRRAASDDAEGFARKPAALVVTRLKRAPFWDELVRAEGRVGIRPESTRLRA